jgi:hypothetical protein
LHPCETAEYAKARGICDELPFAWWVPYTLRKRDIILSKTKARIRKTTHKNGIELPTSQPHSQDIDKKNGNTFWKDALAKEMTEVGIAFEVLDEGVGAPIGFSKVTGHLVWDVKMNFTRKARWVLDDQGKLTRGLHYSMWTPVLESMTTTMMPTTAASFWSMTESKMLEESH